MLYAVYCIRGTNIVLFQVNYDSNIIPSYVSYKTLKTMYYKMAILLKSLARILHNQQDVLCSYQRNFLKQYDELYVPIYLLHSKKENWNQDFLYEY